jgi:hypothetical protein
MLVPNFIIKDQELSDEAVQAYVFIKIHTYSELYESCLFTTPQIVDQIQGYTNSHGVFYKTSQAIKELAEKEVLDIAKEDAVNWRIFMQSFEYPRNECVEVEPEALRNIMDCRVRGKASVLRYYLLLLANISSSSKTCTKEQTWFASQLGISPKSIATYNKYLEELKLIYVYRPTGMYVSNVYGRYEDRERVEKKGALNPNEKRRYAMLYKNAIRGYPYDKTTLIDIKNHMVMMGKDEDLSPLIAKIKGETI